ncbi:39S ribosomal protein L37, mitochondrial [Sergentomyia squamirostris]
MKFTQVLCHQHIGRMIKRHWIISSKKVLANSDVEIAMKNLKKVAVVDANELFQAQSQPVRKEVAKEIPVRQYPPIYSYKTETLLIEGIKQAQVLTKSIALEGLPMRYEKFLENLKIPDDVHKVVQEDILSAHLFDSEQKKLKKTFDPQRPAYNHPRVYGISEERKNLLILDKFIRSCERLTKNKSENLQKKILQNPFLRVTLDKDGDDIGMELKADYLITSAHPIAAVTETISDEFKTLPDLFPLKFTSSLNQLGNNGWVNFYPINSGNRFINPHTIFPTFTTKTKTLYEFDINESQIRSRTLIYAFSAAAARAKQQFGDDVRKLPNPIAVQAIHTNGQSYHFGVLQLNTLDLNGSNGDVNIWHETEIENLYESCSYREGIPTLEAYNPSVLAKFFTFYSQ